MIRVRRFEFAVAMALAGAAHGAVLAGIAGPAPAPAEAPATTVYLDLAALDEDPGAAPAEPVVAAAPELAGLPEPPPPAAAAPVPEAPPPPDLLVAEAPPPDALDEPPPAELPPPPADTMLPQPPPRRDQPPDLPRPRPKPQPPQLARATPEAVVAPAREPPRTEVASAPVAPPPPPATVAPSADALAAYGGKLYDAINATARRNYPRQSLRRGEEGSVPVRLVVDSDGVLVSIEVLDDGTAPRRLVKAAVEAVEGAAPFPAFADVMGVEPAAFEVRILYKLR